MSHRVQNVLSVLFTNYERELGEKSVTEPKDRRNSDLVNPAKVIIILEYLNVCKLPKVR